MTPPASVSSPAARFPMQTNNAPDDDTSTMYSHRLDEITLAKSNASLASSMSRSREIMFVAVITLAQFMTQAGLGQTLAILHVIGDDFGITNPGLLSWLIAGYSLTIGTFILISGRLGDLYGHKRMLLIGYAWFAVFSAVAGLAVYSTENMFIVARILQGIGPSICLPNGLAILGTTYAPGKRKSMAFAIFGASAPGGSIVGSLSGSLFALVWWPWTFWSMAIALACIVVVAHFVVPDVPRPLMDSSRIFTLRETLARCDAIGGLVGVTALVLINFAWNQAGVVGWHQPYVYSCLIVGCGLVGAFFYVESHVSEYPLLPYDALTVDTAFVLSCVACGWGTFGIWIYYIWQIPEVLGGRSPLLTTAYLSPVAISGAAAAIFTGWILQKIHASFVILLAMLAFLTGTILIATMPVNQIYWGQFFISTLIMPIGMDTSFPASSLILSNAVKKEHQGIAASLVNTVVNYSISLALYVLQISCLYCC